MSSIVIAGDTSGSVTLQAPAVAGTTTVNLPSTLGNTSTSAFATTNASGNLGLGVTPSAWTAGGKNIEIGSAGNIIQAQAGQIAVIQNATFNSGWKYSANGFASFALQTTGQHQWFQAASGTAGNAITFTQAMTLDASGNLGIGVSSPANKLHVVGTSFLNVGSYATGYALSFGASSETSRQYQMGMVTGGNFAIYDSAAAATRMLIDTSGNLGIGITPSAWLSSYRSLSLGYSSNGMFSGGDVQLGLTQNAFLNSDVSWRYTTSNPTSQYIQQSGVHTWRSAPSGTAGNAISWAQTMTLDASGNLFVGTTSVLGGVTANLSLYSTDLQNVNCSVMKNGTNNTAGAYIRFVNSSDATIGSVTQNTSTSVLYNVTSDQRLKENIQDADSASSLIDSLQVRKFDWKSDNSHQRYGFVAQELVTIAPEAVHQPVDTDEMMAVDYSKLVPMLVKEIQSLRQRLSAANL